MPNSCAVLGCKNRQSKTLRLFRFPAICKKAKFKELSLIRRNRWLTALQRDDINEKNARVCASHFISGSSASLKDTYNPDWVPSLHMGDPLYPKRQKNNYNCEKKEHAFADLFELIGDGENDNDKSSDDSSDEYSDEDDEEEDDEMEKDHNYSRNLVPEIKPNLQEQEQIIIESNNSCQKTAFGDNITDECIQSYNIAYQRRESTNSASDIDVASCGTSNDFIHKNKNNYHVSDIQLIDPTKMFEKGENRNKIDIFNKTVKDYYEMEQNFNRTSNCYSKIKTENCIPTDKFNQRNDNIYYETNNGIPFVYADTNAENNDTEAIDDKNAQTGEHNYSTTNLEKGNLIEDENYNIVNDNYSDNISNLNKIVFFKPNTREIGTQTCMSNNMFEYLVTEIANKNSIVQQQSSIIAEKDKKIGKLKLKLHKIRLELYHSENRKKK